MFCLLLAAAPAAPAANSLETTYRTAGPAVHAAFEDAREFLQASSAVFRRGRTEIIFGTVVSPEGHILTKASELGDLSDLTVTVDRESYDDPVLIAEDPTWDLALVKIEAEGLVPVDLSEATDPAHGTWVVANGATTRSKRRVQVGVVAANSREVFSKGGTVLGVALKNDDEAIIVDAVEEGTGAAKAGLEEGDRIVSFDGEEVSKREALLELLKKRRVGEVVKIGIRRGDETLEVEVELSGRVDVFGEETTRNDAMSGEYSERRTGFPRIMQHDIMGNRHFMGGPVFDLDGHCVGMNIARFSRCETYAIPAAELRQLAQDMMAQEVKE
ncbi:S1C family serine protease [Haloferula sp. A504]|uniref:S1C family serine protease n=1 Tax=Haloferula sp. A504 TaxID=3373601 RepID=UPI0031CBE613|nr:PDZ domain-containing protein [Verrucomicrobiaceae bacterium E54]